jgi:urease accessory protein
MSSDVFLLPDGAFAAYSEHPRAMPVGVPGKEGFLRLVFERTGGGRSVLRYLERRAPIIVQQALYFDVGLPLMPCVYILSSGGPQVDGDRYEQHFVVRRGAMAHLSTGAATKLAEMRYNHSALLQCFRLEEGAYLEYLPLPTIPCRHSRFRSHTLLDVHPTATLFYSEIFSSGRRYYASSMGDAGGERFAYDILSLTTEGRRHGRTVFRERMVIEPSKHRVQLPGRLAGYEVFATAVVMTPPEQAARIYEAYLPVCEGNGVTALTHLPGRSGLLFRVLGHRTAWVQGQVRSFCSLVRETVKGVSLPPEFPWR